MLQPMGMGGGHGGHGGFGGPPPPFGFPGAGRGMPPPPFGMVGPGMGPGGREFSCCIFFFSYFTTLSFLVVAASHVSSHSTCSDRTGKEEKLTHIHRRYAPPPHPSRRAPPLSTAARFTTGDAARYATRNATPPLPTSSRDALPAAGRHATTRRYATQCWLTATRHAVSSTGRVPTAWRHAAEFCVSAAGDGGDGGAAGWAVV